MSRLERQYSYHVKDCPYGLTMGQWTVSWWKWLLSLPKLSNPALDDEGINSGLNQQGPVWFLAGTFGENRCPVRKSTIPRGKSLLFPVINYEINSAEKPELTTEEQLINDVINDQDDIVNLSAKIDGEKLDVYRVQSDTEIFEVNLPVENCLDIDEGTVKIAADGYWVFIKPLEPGVHHLFFHGSCSGGIRNSTAVYNLTIA